MECRINCITRKIAFFPKFQGIYCQAESGCYGDFPAIFCFGTCNIKCSNTYELVYWFICKYFLQKLGGFEFNVIFQNLEIL